MKEFTCKSLGNDCSWKHLARTEELLADMAALHLREVHGMKEISPELLGKIKHSFTGLSTEEAAAAEKLFPEEGPVMMEFSCKDLGMNCGFRYIAQTEDLIADGVAMHAREAHDIRDFTPELAVKVKRLAHAWKR